MIFLYGSSTLNELKRHTRELDSMMKASLQAASGHVLGVNPLRGEHDVKLNSTGNF